VLLAIAISLPIIASDKKDEGTAAVSFVVLKEDSGKPIRNAAVILHPVNQKGKQAKTGFELKSDNDGQTHFDGIPYGTWRVQVIAPGFQTFGDDYTINQNEQSITIRMQRPKEQYSIYDNHDSGGSNNNAAPPPKDKQQ
jgi:hypothetical protein